MQACKCGSLHFTVFSLSINPLSFRCIISEVNRKERMSTLFDVSKLLHYTTISRSMLNRNYVMSVMSFVNVEEDVKKRDCGFDAISSTKLSLILA